MMIARAGPSPSRVEGCEKRIHIIQGEYSVSDNADVVLTTLLGSCVAACLRDPVARIGGMNHFLLPGQEAGESAARNVGEHYGVHLMELLVNGLLRRGARRERLEGKLFGGARTMEGLADIGARNASFAERFLRHEGIRLAGASLGGERGRRLQFWPVSGRARQAFLSASQTPTAQAVAVMAEPNSVEFF